MDLIEGTPLTSETFVLRLTVEEVSMCAWGLMRLADEMSPERKHEAHTLSFALADLSGDH